MNKMYFTSLCVILDKTVMWTGLLNLGMSINLGEGKLRNQTC